MLAKLNFLQSKYILLIAFMVILSQPLSAAKSCDYRVFNIKTLEKVTSIELLTQIADSCDFSIIVKDTFASTLVQKELYGVNIKNLSLDEIFEVLIGDNDLYYEYNKNFLKISALKTKTFKVDYITSVRTGTAGLDASLEGASEDGDTTSTSSSVNNILSNESFDFWSEMEKEISSILNTGAEEYTALPPIINQNAGLITVTGSKTQLNRIKDYLKMMKKRLHKQVLIDVSILTVGFDNSSQKGVDWTKFDLKLDSTTALHSFTDYKNVLPNNDTGTSTSDAIFTLDGVVSFLNETGDAQVVSNPKILALNNQQALITIGDNINYKLITITNRSSDNPDGDQSEEIKSIFVGVLLNITPQITETGEIILRINPSVSEFKNTEDEDYIADRTSPPDTSEKKLSTVVKVKNGNTIILGGLITNKKGFKENAVPILGDIPFLGYAFKHEEITDRSVEMIFVITPRIIGAKDDTKATLKDLGFSKKIYDQ